MTFLVICISNFDFIHAGLKKLNGIAPAHFNAPMTKNLAYAKKKSNILKNRVNMLTEEYKISQKYIMQLQET